MKKRDKKYRPRTVLAVPMMFRHAIEGETMLKLTPHAAFQRLKDGDGTEEDLDTLAQRLNWALVSQRDFYANSGEAQAMGALSAILSAKERLARLGSAGFSGLELQAVGDGLVLADRMGDELTRKEALAAFKKVVEWNAKATKGQTA